MNRLENWLRDLVLQKEPRKKSVFVQTTKSIPKKSIGKVVVVKHYIQPEETMTHEERALEIIDNLPDVPLPLRRVPGPLKFLEPAKAGAKWLIRKDPFGLID